MGLPGQINDPSIRASIGQVMAVGKRRGIPIMITITHFARPPTVEAAKQFIEKGARIITFGSVERAIRATCVDTVENIVKKIR